MAGRQQEWPHARVHRDDNFNPISSWDYGYLGADHHWLIAHEPEITPKSAAATQVTFVERLQMLLSVDDAIDGIAGVLDREGVLDNTYLVFCADQ